jgi:hypothetical protein
MKHIILETDRLMLREMDFSDVEALASMLQDDRVMYAYNGAFNDRETLLWLQKQIQRYNDYGFGLWGVSLRNSDEMIGQCGITLQDYKTTQVPEIGYLFAHKHWHKGMLQKQPSLVGSTASINFSLKSCIQSSEILTKHPKM